MAKVTEKTGKSEIFEAYKAAEKALKEKEALLLNFQKEADLKAKGEKIERVEKIKIVDMEAAINALTTDLGKINDSLKIYNDLKEAIASKEAELKETIEIQKTAYSLAALVNTQDELRNKFNEEMAEKKAALQTELTELRAEISKLEAEFEARKEADEKAFVERVKREENEYNYEFSRKKKLEQDKFNDELAQKKKAFFSELEGERKILETEREALSKIEKDLTERAAEFEGLRMLVDSFPSKLEEEKTKVADEARERAQKSFTFQKTIIEKENEGKVKLLESKVDSLTANLEDSKQLIADLRAELSSTVSKLETLASKTVDGASSAKLVSALESQLKEKFNTKGA